MFGLMAPLFVGSLGMGAETALWYVDQRNAQNAADAATLAAGMDGTAANYANVANAVAAQYGFVNGTNGVTVTPTNTAACPGGGNTCYSVAITMKQQLYLLPVVGYSGNTTFNGSPATTIQSTATAKSNPTIHKYCLLTLAGVVSSLGTNGAPSANLAGCSIMSDGGAQCNGHNLGADYGDAVMTNSGCGVVEQSNVPTVPDPYSYIKNLIPTNTCSSYPQEDKHGNGGSALTGNLDGSSGTIILCGDQKLSGNVTIVNAPATGVRVVVENGQLDTNGNTFATASGSTATLVFSGTTSGNYTHYATGGGTLNIQAPTSGQWSGVAMVQDPNLTKGIDFSYSGNSPTWDLTGLVYVPGANIGFSGAVNKSSFGASCFVLVSYTLLINGTADILETGGCPQAGLSMPTNQVGNRAVLVY